METHSYSRNWEGIKGQKVLRITKDKLEDMDVSLCLPTWGHDFYRVIVTQQVTQIPKCQMKDTNNIFS